LVLDLLVAWVAVRRVLAAVAIVVVACGTPAAAPQASAPLGAASPSASAATIAPTASPTPAPKPRFPHGLYVVQPALQHPGGVLEVLEASSPIPARVEFFGIGYDVSDDFVVATNMTNSGLVLFGADGTQKQVPVQGIFALGRPSLSPDAKFAVVQATETAPTPGAPMPKFLTDYVIDLSTGSTRRLIPPGTREFAEGRELPRWFPAGDRILYQTNDFSTAASGCDIVRVVDVGTGATLLTIGANGPGGCFNPTPATGPRFHAEPSFDGTKILIPGQMQTYDAKTGQLLSDIRKPVLDALSAAGYKPDTRFGGQGGAGTFPLDGSLSPDGRTITFDGAVEKDGAFGVLLCRVNVDGTAFTVLRGPIPVMPMFSNGHNFSQVLPHWR
jgi:hypothetical protein